MSEPLTRVPTPSGDAVVHHLSPDGAPRALLVLTHGAGGGVDAPDLRCAARVATGLGLAVALVEQPYRVAGRRSPPQAPRVDAAWCAVVDHLRVAMPGVPFITGGRSFGARVACRTAHLTGPVAVLCLAFPLQPPGRPAPSRLPELDGVAVPVLVVQGDRDPFGCPPARDDRRVVVVRGDHALKADLPAVGDAVSHWLGLTLG